MKASQWGIRRDWDFFLSEDILQGEEVPFYLQWSGEPPKEISLIATGFTSISRLFNTQGVEVERIRQLLNQTKS